MTSITQGSEIAKGGYREEAIVASDLNTNEKCRETFTHFLGHEQTATFEKIPGRSKTDVSNGVVNMQIKKHKKNQFGQVDRHPVDFLLNKIPTLAPVGKILKGMCELPLKDDGTCDKRFKPIKYSEYTAETITNFLNILNENKRAILEFALLGYQVAMCPEILVGVEYEGSERKKVTFYKMTDVINFLMTLDFQIMPRKTSVGLGKVFTMQRKGGDCGKKGANQIQMKLVFTKLVIANKAELIIA